MKRLMYLSVLVIVLVLSFPISSMGLVSNMELIENEANNRFLHVYSTDGQGKIIVDMDNGVISISLNDFGVGECTTDYYNNVGIVFDSDKPLNIPLYCYDSPYGTVFLYNFDSYHVKMFTRYLKKYYTLRVRFPDSPVTVVFDLVGFIYMHDVVARQ